METKKLAQKTFSHRELPILDGLFTMHPDAAFRRAWCGLSNVFQEHMAKEEHMLFPAILAGYTGLEGPVTVMQMEHEEIRRFEGELRRLSKVAGPHETRLLAFLDDLAEHSRIEDEELFPAARESASAFGS
jgi:iron-sulfur cluster repair protein YtfE (RIC family)